MAHADRTPERLGLIVLAAGAGVRMRSVIPKPLHTVAGIPMISRVLNAGEGADPDRRVVVIGPDAAELDRELAEHHDVLTVVQHPPRGTGDAVQLALEAMPDVQFAVVLYADHPLLEPGTVRRLVDGLRESRAQAAVVGVILPDAAGYGRIVRDQDGRATAIIERRDDDPEQRTGPVEINAGLMALDANWARENLPRIAPSDATGEIYLTELIALAVADAHPDKPWPVIAVRGDEDAASGVNDRIDLARAESRAWARKRERLMQAGVTMRLPETIVIDEGVEVGPDTIILPHTSLHGLTSVGSACVLGPGTTIADSRIGDRVIVRSSTVIESTIADDTDIGPYAHLRGGSEIGPRAHIGNYAELKNAQLGPGVKVGHFSYLGDTEIGEETNIGAGTVTANFDGAAKHRTRIGSRAFIGSDTILRAPVQIGDGARTGAGSVVTKDVPAGVTVVGVPARRAPSAAARQRRAANEAEAQ